MQTRDTKLHVLDGYDAGSLRRAIMNEISRLRDVAGQPHVDGAEATKIANEVERLSQIFAAFDLEEGGVARLHISKSI
jgi:hypothetical protein